MREGRRGQDKLGGEGKSFDKLVSVELLGGRKGEKRSEEREKQHEESRVAMEFDRLVPRPR